MKKKDSRLFLKTLTLVFVLAAPTAVLADAHGLIGDKIADFSATITSVTMNETENLLNIESDKDVGAFGKVLATLTFKVPSDPSQGTGEYSSIGAAFTPDGKIIRFQGQGVWKALGNHRWEVKTTSLNSNNQRSYAVGIVELSTRSFKGSVYSLD